MDNGTGIQVKFNATAFAEVIDATAPSSEATIIDVSHHGSSGGREFLVGDLIDNGELKVTMALIEDRAFVVGDSGPVEFIFPDGGSWGFTGIVSGLTQSTPLEDKMTTEVTFKVSGEITYTAP